MAHSERHMDEPGEKLEEAVLCYLKALDAGSPRAFEEAMARFPELADDLKKFRADQEGLGVLLSPLRAVTRDVGGDTSLLARSVHQTPGAPSAYAGPAPPHAGKPTGATMPYVEPEAPPAIPGHEILGVLGQGGMAVVYKARQIRLNRIIALKMIRAHRPADASTQARFQTEGQTVARLTHPNIVCVYESGEVDGRPYFILEYVQGGTLAQARQDGPWAPRAAAKMVVLLADAVDYAHGQRVIHRDLKPSNILLTPDGTPKIADFGLSKQLQNQAQDMTLTGDCLGTPAYMPKELAEGRLEAVGPGTDVFGLGAILYDLLTGRAPHDGDSVDQVMASARQGKITPPRQIRPDLPVAVERICLRALAPDPRQRYASAAAMAKDLRKYLSPVRRVVRVAAWLTALAATAAAAFILLPMLTGPHEPALPGKAGSEELARKALAVLEERCHRCHGRDGRAEGGFNYVLDRRQLVRRAKIVPGDPEASPVFKRVQDGEMPPGTKVPGLLPTELAVLKEWIRAGAPEDSSVAPARPLMATEDILKVIRADLENNNKQARPFLRYFTITHLYNAGLSEDELQSYRSGLAKLVNSLSWQLKIVVPAALDPAQTIFRIDMRDYGWDEAVWKVVLDTYPYGLSHDSEAARFCAVETKSLLPFVRADWFVFAATRPPLYYRALQLPDTAAALEKTLDVNVADHLRQERVARAGFNGSGVSSNNRVIERHDSRYGAYWKSYDFAPAKNSPDGRKNIFQHPLGPGAGKSLFQHDGGEIIFNLPNGLQGYLLVDKTGKRIDRGPTEIVKDARQKDATVINGISCMGCHAKGIIDKADQVRATVLQNFRGFEAAEIATIKAIYLPRDDFKALTTQDAERFAKAVRGTGAHLSETEPIVALASRYEWELDLNQAAGEVGLKPKDFREGLDHARQLARNLGPLLIDGGTVQRQVFEGNFSELIRELRLGQPQNVGLEGRTQDLPDSDVLTNTIGMKLKLLPADNLIRAGKRLLIGVHEVTQEQYRNVMGANPSHFSPTGEGKELVRGLDTDSFPVDSVSYKNAVAFCTKLSDSQEEKGRAYRLPTEAEWVRACRAGQNAAPGDDPKALARHGWYENNASARTHPVGTQFANAWGLYDMQGNVAEWCEGFFFEAGLALRVVRGGSWKSSDADCRSEARGSGLADFANRDDRGFRVVLELDEQNLRALNLGN
jgi:tRNA A-37 threonylcarbamoyl transferase component Bud32/mono/diheme cytochrome c family protein